MNDKERTMRPNVLIVDDEPSDQRALILELEAHVDADVAGPEEVTQHQLDAADLVLVDYKLTNWREVFQSEPKLPIARQPTDGFALVAVLRAHAENVERPKAFALRTGHPQEISRPLPPDRREYAISHRYNLEWVFPKAGDDGMRAVQRIASLARAVRELPDSWPFNDPKLTQRIVHKLLAFPEDAEWGPRALVDVEACHPPVHELSAGTHGLAFLRWLLHQILPYPCFLWDSQRLAARLHVSHEVVNVALEATFGQLLEPYRYKGILTDFLGARWWKSGIEAFLWDFTDGNSFDMRAVRTALTEKGKIEVGTSDYDNPVIGLNSDLQFLPGLYEARDTVRIQPDDWPPYADEAWATVSSAKEDPKLAALVISQDRERLEEV
jgi:hypothetical protein